MNTWFLAAAALGVLTCLAHLFLGGRGAARPLLAADGLASMPRYTHYFCWHIVTILLAAQGGGYAWAAMAPDGLDVAVILTLIALATTLWNFLMIARHRLKWQQHPQFIFFLPMTILGTGGILAG